MPTWIVSAVIAFLLRQVAKFGTSTDWAKVKADAHARLAPVTPDWAEPAAFELVDKAVDVCAYVLKDVADLQRLADKCVSGDFMGALAVLEELLTKAVAGGVAHAEAALAACKALAA